MVFHSVLHIELGWRDSRVGKKPLHLSFRTSTYWCEREPGG
jgi:hypothetical protein